MFLFLTFSALTAFVDSLNGLKVLMKARMVVSLIFSCLKGFPVPYICFIFRVDFVLIAELRFVPDFCIMLRYFAIESSSHCWA